MRFAPEESGPVSYFPVVIVWVIVLAALFAFQQYFS
jgi:hypothetical protein